MIELKNGKVVCKQKPVSLEKQSETLQEIVKFRDMLEKRIEAKRKPILDIPDEYKPVIAKLAHESDKGATPLAKHIRQQLLPAQDEEDEEKSKEVGAALPQSAVELSITAILDRNNYGLDAPTGSKLPTSLAVWRWEVKQQYLDWLPKAAREKAESRLEERKQAKQALLIIFDALPQSEKDALFTPTKGGNDSKKIKDSNKLPVNATPEPSDKAKSESKPAESAKKLGKKKAADPENDQADTPAPKPKKPVDPEKAAREKERLEKKAAKAEKEQKAIEAKNKSRTIMTSFFKPKIAASSTPSPSKIASASSSQSEFDRVFKPFVLKKDSVLAPINWFRESKNRKHPNGAEIIVIDDDGSVSDIEMVDNAQLNPEKLSRMSGRQRLENLLSSLPLASDPRRLPRRRIPSGYKVFHPTSVRDVVAQLSEAEVTGDDALVRVLLATLRDRKAYPAKVFIFHEDARPGFFGTWTRSSKVIGPRTPLARDPLTLDYGYDSGEEWEEEPVGDDVADDDDDDDGNDEDRDSDADSWLVDDDEEVEVDVRDLDSLDAPDIFDLPLPPPPKRKAEDGEKKGSKKRKVVVPLVAFSKGPCWEDTIGSCTYEPFNQYRIQLFNDTPFPIDPFTYVSTCVEDFRDFRASVNKSTAATATGGDGFVIPSLPPRLNGAMPVSSDAASSSSTTTTPQPPKKQLKHPFPDVHLPVLVNKVLQSDTGSLVLLIELIYEELKANKVTKAAVEVKVREVCEKVQKKWTVKAAYMSFSAPSSNGIAPQVSS
ncbi:hypothetical protein FA15DRAFT_635715 [Coprinopsis marcescibilis]|uniref:Chromatin assembly factor 1 subunit A n=1 Tax=Coprinopsis marcescibilis TaxID=230819 RepID=A0A5C3L428_COPMA|nr:hypothetical protein FA15DRAFT_635715 [Coprinopsis marcescibilis]